ncbi:hypothetical protein HK105_205782 [Polyrhizophydium stewartii]|uniref:Uncharacterized protein n=1 Tax=Polyrhizophydium stewartii TaxID=2732419 RepID=A0ABR4N595_9FUNG
MAQRLQDLELQLKASAHVGEVPSVAAWQSLSPPEAWSGSSSGSSPGSSNRTAATAPTTSAPQPQPGTQGQLQVQLQAQILAAALAQARLQPNGAVEPFNATGLPPSMIALLKHFAEPSMVSVPSSVPLLPMGAVQVASSMMRDSAQHIHTHPNGSAGGHGSCGTSHGVGAVGISDPPPVDHSAPSAMTEVDPKLMNLLFEHVSTAFPLLERNSLYVALHSPFLVNAAQAVASRYVRSPRHGKPLYRDGEIYYRRAVSLMGTVVLEGPSYTNIVALMLLAFWSVDREAAIPHSVPFCIERADPKLVPYPADLGTPLSSPPDGTASDGVDAARLAGPVPTTVFFMELIRTISKIHQLNEHEKEAIVSEASPEEVTQIAVKRFMLHSELEAWYQSLPEHFKTIHSKYGPVRTPEVPMTWRDLYMLLKYHTYRIELLLPNIVRMVDLGLYASAASDPLFATCVESTFAIDKMLQVMLAGNPYGYHVPPGFNGCLLSPAKTLWIIGLVRYERVDSATIDAAFDRMIQFSENFSMLWLISQPKLDTLKYMRRVRSPLTNTAHAQEHELAASRLQSQLFANVSTSLGRFTSMSRKTGRDARVSSHFAADVMIGDIVSPPIPQMPFLRSASMTVGSWPLDSGL